MCQGSCIFLWKGAIVTWHFMSVSPASAQEPESGDSGKFKFRLLSTSMPRRSSKILSPGWRWGCGGGSVISFSEELDCFLRFHCKQKNFELEKNRFVSETPGTLDLLSFNFGFLASVTCLSPNSQYYYSSSLSTCTCPFLLV